MTKDNDMARAATGATAPDSNARRAWERPELTSIPIGRTRTGVLTPGESGLPVPLDS